MAVEISSSIEQVASYVEGLGMVEAAQILPRAALVTAVASALLCKDEIALTPVLDETTTCDMLAARQAEARPPLSRNMSIPRRYGQAAKALLGVSPEQFAYGSFAVDFRRAHRKVPRTERRRIERGVATAFVGSVATPDTFASLADIPMRTVWANQEWDRGMFTTIESMLPLPELPGTAVYIDPGLRRLCATVMDSSQGVWERTVLSGVNYFLKELITNPSFGRYDSPQANFEMTQATDPLPVDSLQLVCFDSIRPQTDPVAIELIVTAADAALEPGGLLLLGGRYRPDDASGRRRIDDSIGVALETLDLLYEEEQSVGKSGYKNYQVVFARS